MLGALALWIAALCASAVPAGPRFEVSLPAGPGSQPITGRLFLLVSTHNEPEVRLQSMWFDSPQIVGMDVSRLRPGESVTVDETVLGTPLASLGEIQAGDYYVQAVLNVYTEFRRADGRTVWAHMDQWEGQQFNRSPGNPYSDVGRVRIDPTSDQPIKVRLDHILPPLPVIADTPWVKRVKIRSDRLTRFWGRPIYLGAVILLPRDYASEPGTRYPVIYHPWGHFNTAPPFNFGTDRPFTAAWQSAGFPPMIAVSLLDPTPFADWSGAMNSVNNGPYRDAIMEELIPYIETKFRVRREPHARVLTGNASGGRTALALQLQQPDFFGGAWIFQPWPFNFRHYSALDIYNDANAYRVARNELPAWARGVTDWLPIPRYIGRVGDGSPFVTFEQLSRHDAVMAGMAAGDPIGADDAIVGPVGDDGTPKKLWDRRTGEIDRTVAAHWRNNGDLAVYAERHWATLGPRLEGKLHFYVGERDHFHRDEGVRALEQALRATPGGLHGTTFEYGPRAADWQPMTNAELVRQMAQHVAGKRRTR